MWLDPLGDEIRVIGLRGIRLSQASSAIIAEASAVELAFLLPPLPVLDLRLDAYPQLVAGESGARASKRQRLLMPLRKHPNEPNGMAPAWEHVVTSVVACLAVARESVKHPSATTSFGGVSPAAAIAWVNWRRGFSVIAPRL